MIAQSAMLTPAARTRIRTSCSPISGFVDVAGLKDGGRAVGVLDDGLHRWSPVDYTV